MLDTRRNKINQNLNKLRSKDSASEKERKCKEKQEHECALAEEITAKT